MASLRQNLILAIQTRGAAKAGAEMAGLRHETNELRRSTVRNNRELKRANSLSAAYNRAIRLTQTRTLLWGAAIGIASIALAALSPGLAFITGGLIALGTAMGPLLGLFGVAALVFTNQFKIVGTAANDLFNAFLDFRQHFEQAFGPAGNIILKGLGTALQIITPMIDALAPSMTILAQALSQGILQFATGLVALTPMMTKFILGIGPLIPKIVELVLALMSAWLEMAIRGLPAAMILLDWLIVFAHWLTQATIDIDNFLRSAQGQETLQHLVEVVNGLWGALQILGGFLFLIITHLGHLGAVVKWGTLLLADYLVVSRLVTASVWLYDAAMGAATITTWAFPGTWIVLGIAAIIAILIAAVVYWKEWTTWVGNAWDKLSGIPTLAWSKIHDGLDEAVNYIIGKINWVIDQLNAINPLADIGHVGQVGSPAGRDARKGRGTVLRPSPGAPPLSGTFRGASVVDTAPPVLQGDIHAVIPITNMLDGKVLAKTIHRQSVKKKSTK